MRNTSKIAAILSATAALSLFLAASAFAEQRPSDETRHDHRYLYGDPRYGHGDPRDGRVSMQGRIRSFSHERDGYRVYLDRGNYSYRVPPSALGRHRLSVGLEIRLGGVFRDGYVDVDALGCPGDAYYDEYGRNDGYGDGSGNGYGDRYRDRYGSGYLSGRVQRVDYRNDRLLLREDRSGRSVEVDMRAVEHGRRRLDLGDLRRGDRITLSGSWERGGFRADHVDSISQH